MTFIAHMLQATPAWVFALLAALSALGVRQMRPSRRTVGRALQLPAAMAAFSLYGMVAARHAQPAAWVAWILAALATAAFVASRPVPEDTRFDPVDAVFHLPGSIRPLLLMLGIFCTKYTVAVALALHPAMSGDPLFAGAVSLLYGVFTGASAGRALRLLGLWWAAREGVPPLRRT
ncbi:DUF6622 family protein [Paracidovorax avenae]|uniref:DUF6622 family protein n=1 Tax=Paracidovorax avenae TaxID=80867 RepID=UPI000D217BD2|nr:DUF6622 family protein [Paracidovorax avenae]AVT13941.1 hypothetical protein C8235_14325 [Paracidovorax avenae]